MKSKLLLLNHTLSTIVYTSSPILFLALSSELISSTSTPSQCSAAEVGTGCVGSVDGGVMLGKSICISIDGDGAAIGDDDRLDDILLLVLNFDV